MVQRSQNNLSGDLTQIFKTVNVCVESLKKQNKNNSLLL